MNQAEQAAMAVEALDSIGVDAVYQPKSGQAVTLKALLQKRQTESTGQARGEYAEIRIATSAVAAPRADDAVTLDGETWTVRSGPLDQIGRRTVGGCHVLRVSRNEGPSGRNHG